MNINTESKIVWTLYHRVQLTTRQISEYADTSWVTAKKYLLHLYSQGVVAQKKHPNRIYWKITPEARADLSQMEKETQVKE